MPNKDYMGLSAKEMAEKRDRIRTCGTLCNTDGRVNRYMEGGANIEVLCQIVIVYKSSVIICCNLKYCENSDKKNMFKQ